MPAWTELSRSQQILLRGWSSCPEGEAEGLFSLEKSWFQGNQSKLPVPKGVSEMEPNFSMQRSEDKRWSELEHGKFRQAIRRKFSRGTMSQWSSLLRTIVKIFSISLEKAQSKMLWPHDWPWFEQEVELDISTCPFQMEWSCHHELTTSAFNIKGNTEGEVILYTASDENPDYIMGVFLPQRSKKIMAHYKPLFLRWWNFSKNF